MSAKQRFAAVGAAPQRLGETTSSSDPTFDTRAQRVLVSLTTRFGANSIARTQRPRIGVVYELARDCVLDDDYRAQLQTFDSDVVIDQVDGLWCVRVLRRGAVVSPQARAYARALLWRRLSIGLMLLCYCALYTLVPRRYAPCAYTAVRLVARPAGLC